jgi:hypothetical protein
MLFQFAPAIQAGINSGAYEIVRNTATGQLLGLVRDKATGQFVAHAVGLTTKVAGLSINSLFAPAQLAMGGLHMAQTHLGFQKTYRMLDVLQNSVVVLQSSINLIGVGTVAAVALSAVNLYQTLKLREDVKQLRLEVKHGFIDLKEALKDQGAEIIQRIDQVAQDIKFEQHRLEFVKAYGQFLQATRQIKIAMSCEDLGIRNANLANAIQTLGEALAIYNNPHLLSETCAAGYLRRVECAWAIEQTIALTYQLQNQPAAVSHQLCHLQDKVRQDSLTVIERCTEEELDFLFPELIRIHTHDLPVLESWQNHVDWVKTLSLDERQLLASSDIPPADNLDSHEESAVLAEPEEQLLYENLKQKSHYLSLRDQLKFMVKPDLRREHESYISQKAPASAYKALAPSNWQDVPDLTVANLYWYFKEVAA